MHSELSLPTQQSSLIPPQASVNGSLGTRQQRCIILRVWGTRSQHRLQLFADSFRDHQVKCVSHTPAMPLIMHLDYAEFTQTLIHVSTDRKTIESVLWFSEAVVAFLHFERSLLLNFESKQHSSLLNFIAISEIMVDCFRVGCWSSSEPRNPVFHNQRSTLESWKDRSLVSPDKEIVAVRPVSQPNAKRHHTWACPL